MRTPTLLPLFLLAALAAPLAQAEDARPPWDPPKIQPYEALTISPTQPLAPKEQRRIRGLIKQLAALNDTVYGIYRDVGYAFAPHEPPVFPRRKGRPPRTKAESEALNAFRELTSLGPTAMPFLLVALDDATLTQYLVKAAEGFGGQSFNVEVLVNLSLPEECETIRRYIGVEPSSGTNTVNWGTSAGDYRVRVGDVCFAILGQITNRAYEPIRSQPTNCAEYNSPTTDPRIARAVRAQWAGKDLRIALAKRLMADFHTPTDCDEHGDRGWGDGLRQVGAARRLDYYFGAAAEALLVRRLESLDAGEEDGRDARNDLETGLFVQAMTLSSRPAVVRAVLEVGARATGPRILSRIMSAPKMPADDMLFEQARTVVLARAKMASVAGRKERDLLKMIHRRWPDRSPRLLEAYLKAGNEAAVLHVLGVIQYGEIRMSPRFWRPLLDDTRPALERESGWPKSFRGLRVCDVAAMHYVMHHKDSTFGHLGEEAVRDEQIASIRKAIDEAYTTGEKK